MLVGGSRRGARSPCRVADLYLLLWVGVFICSGTVFKLRLHCIQLFLFQFLAHACGGLWWLVVLGLNLVKLINNWCRSRAVPEPFAKSPIGLTKLM